MLFGQNDEHLKAARQHLNAKIVARGDEIRISGQEHDVKRAKDAFDTALDAIRGGFPRNVEDALAITATPDNTPKSAQTNGSITLPGRHKARTPGQHAYLKAIASHAITFGIGPAGTGKTYLAVAMAVQAFIEKRVKRIVLTRPAVEAGEKLGFLPGDLQAKIDPYLRPLYDALHDLLPAEKAERYVESGTIEVAPLAFMRGRTLNDAFIILDEAQNTTDEQMKMFLTRMGFGSTVVVTGDVTQTDLPGGIPSGLSVAERTLSDVDGIAFVRFGDQDVVRHPLVAAIVRSYGRTETETLA